MSVSTVSAGVRVVSIDDLIALGVSPAQATAIATRANTAVAKATAKAMAEQAITENRKTVANWSVDFQGASIPVKTLVYRWVALNAFVGEPKDYENAYGNKKTNYTNPVQSAMDELEALKAKVQEVRAEVEAEFELASKVFPVRADLAKEWLLDVDRSGDLLAAREVVNG